MAHNTSKSQFKGVLFVSSTAPRIYLWNKGGRGKFFKKTVALSVGLLHDILFLKTEWSPKLMFRALSLRQSELCTVQPSHKPRQFAWEAFSILKKKHLTIYSKKTVKVCTFLTFTDIFPVTIQCWLHNKPPKPSRDLNWKNIRLFSLGSTTVQSYKIYHKNTKQNRTRRLSTLI